MKTTQKVCGTGRWTGVCFVVAMLLGLSQSVLAAGTGDKAKNPLVWQPRITSVTVFKNNLGFFMSEGKVKLRDGWAIAPQVPPAAFGTLVIFSHDEGTLVDIVGSGPGEVVEFDGQDAPDTAEARRSRLLSLQHLNLELKYKRKESPATAAGTLKSVGPEYVVLESRIGDIAVPLESISSLQVLDYPLRVHVIRDDGSSPDEVTLGMAYLQSGITWIPEYTMKILGETSAELSLRGVLVNQAEDLIHADINFVVGVPHFAHTDYQSPLAVGQVVRTIRGLASAVVPPQIQSQIANRAAIVRNDRTAPQFKRGGTTTAPVGSRPGNVASTLGNLPELGGTAGSDFTVYRKRDLTVRRGEKALVSLFVRPVTYSHVYRWSPPQKMQHLLRLHNATDTSWTTGPCLVLGEKGPLSEDLLRYTPAGGNAEIPISQAINIAHEVTERESARKLKAHNPRSSYYLDLVTLTGKVKLHNFEEKQTEVFVTMAVPGRPLEATHDGAAYSDAKKLVLTERRGSISWRVLLAAGESRTLTYCYERYVPSWK
jgi:hypothetical protein